MDLLDSANGEGESLTPTQEFVHGESIVLFAFEGAGGVHAHHGSAQLDTGRDSPRSDIATFRLNMPPHMGAVLQALAHLIPDFNDLWGGDLAGGDENALIASLKACHWLFVDGMDAGIRALSGVECKSMSMNEQGKLNMCGAPISEGGPSSRSARFSLTKRENFLDANQFAVFAVEIGQAGLFPSTRCVA